MKSIIKYLIAAILLVNSSFAFSLNQNSCDYSNFTQSDLAAVEANLAQSRQLLLVSQNLLTLSAQMLDDPANANIAYVDAMLRLSDDIGKMAERIGEMSDRIVATELQIGIMADRILETQKLQNQNVALTQANLLKAQENFNKLLLDLSN